MTVWTKEKIISEIQRLSENGVAPATAENGSLYSAAMRLFGSWDLACKISGVISKGRIQGRRIRVKRIRRLPMTKRREILDNINDLMKTYCHPCIERYHVRDTTYCTKKCDIGKQIRENGKKLEGVKNEGS